MTFFTKEEFKQKYNQDVQDYQIEMSCEMIYSQVGLVFRRNWNKDTAPEAIKNASMEQLRFMLEYDIPLLDNRGKIEAGAMKSDLKTDYSTLALRILANHGYMYRGSPLSYNKGIKMTYGD